MGGFGVVSGGELGMGDAGSVWAGVGEGEAGGFWGEAVVVDPFVDDAVGFVGSVEAWVEGLAVALGVVGALPEPAVVGVIGDDEPDGRLGAGTDEG